VDTVVGNPSCEQESRSPCQEALSPEEARETPTVENEFVSDKVTVDLDETSVQELKKKFRYKQHPKISVKMKELQHKLQESRCLGFHREVFRKLKAQVNSESDKGPVQYSCQPMEVHLEGNLNLTEQTEELHGSPESVDNVHREMKQSDIDASGVTDEVKTQRVIMERYPDVDVKQVTDTVKHSRHLWDIGNEKSGTPHRANEVLPAETQTAFGAIQDKGNGNEPDADPIPKRSISVAMGVLTKCEKLIDMCTKIINVLPDNLLFCIINSNAHHLYQRLFYILTEISFLIIKFLSDLLSAFASMIYIIIHSDNVEIMSENIISAVDTMMLTLPYLEMKYTILCFDYLLKLNILTTERIDQELQNNRTQTECKQTDLSEHTEVSGEKTESSSQGLETLNEQDEACCLAMSEVARCSVTYPEKCAVKTRLMVIGIMLTSIGHKILSISGLV
jgi:hypothetical protein